MLAGKRLDEGTIAALVKNINSKVQSRNDEVKRIEDAQVERLTNLGWDKETAKSQVYGLADRSDETAEIKTGLQSLSPQSKKVINDYAKSKGISPEVAYQIYLDKVNKGK